MKKIFCAIFVVAALCALVACQSASASAHVDDNGSSGTGYGSINDPTPVAPLVIDAETGEPISDEPGEAFVLASDADADSYSCNPEDGTTIYTEPNDDLGPGKPRWMPNILWDLTGESASLEGEK